MPAVALVWAACECRGAERMDTSTNSLPQAVDGNSDKAARVAWWSQARFGMFIHWGLYSVAADDFPGAPHGRYSEWLLSRGVSSEAYRRTLLPRFNPSHYRPEEWAALAREAGMGYVVLTTKHHEGFALWPSDVTDYDVMSSPYGKDLIAPFVKACRSEHLRVGFYHSILDWSHPDYVPRQKQDARPPADASVFPRYLDYLQAQTRELLTRYGPVDIWWWDGGWDHAAEGNRAAELNGMIRKLQPAILINNRSGLPEDFDTPEQEIPAKPPAGPWESCMTINGSWGFHRMDHSWKSVDQLLQILSSTATLGGNLLLNVGPDAEGRIPQASVERLKAIGAWMRVHGDAIRGTTGNPLGQKPVWGGCTVHLDAKGGGRLFLHIYDPANTTEIRLDQVSVSPVSARWMESADPIQTGMEKKGGGLWIKCAANAQRGPVPVIELVFDRPFLGERQTP